MHMMVGDVFCGQWLEGLKQEKEEKARGWKDERRRHCYFEDLTTTSVDMDGGCGWVLRYILNDR